MELVIPKKFRSNLDEARLNLTALTSLKAINHSENEGFSLKITDNKTIRKLNREFRGIDEPTDILSFPNPYSDPETGSFYLGDIIISLEFALTQSQENKNNLQDEIEMLLVHGILHLCGYDHTDHQQYLDMNKLQDLILNKLGNPLLGSIHLVP